MQIVLFNKPFGVVSQFTVPGSRSGPAAAETPPTLKDFLSQRGIYPAGRLDADSEGLLVLTDDGVLQHRLTDPRHKLEKTYFAQVEGEPDAAALATLVRGVRFAEHVARATRARLVSEPEWLWARTPPIRVRQTVPTRWLEIRLTEGRNRQVRRMTAAVGHPTLRLIRHAVGPWTLDGIRPGFWREVPAAAQTVGPRRQRGS